MGEREPNSPPRKRLALFFDGTWNEPGSHTNVWRLYLMLAGNGQDNVPQESFYDEGVGTHWYDRISGGAFGAGLSWNVRNGYRWLMEHYDPNDEIYLFGFSRGAFTARSLAGLIARCGLLRPESPISFSQIFERYQRGDSERPIYELIRMKDDVQHFTFEEKALLQHSYYHRNLIKMVGVWDTVGSIGIPFGTIKGISRRTLQFYNTHLSNVVQHSYQALAIDEQRSPYWAILWTMFMPDHPDPGDPAANENRIIEQRWFSGAHANVGGGYRSDLLPQRPLEWMQKKASMCGLGFRSVVSVTDDDLRMGIRDSYAEFCGGLWKVLTFGKRYERWIMSNPVSKVTKTGEKGRVITVNERIDLSVIDRCRLYSDYRPPNLSEWARRKNLDLEEFIRNPNAHPELWSPVDKAEIDNVA